MMASERSKTENLICTDQVTKVHSVYYTVITHTHCRNVFLWFMVSTLPLIEAVKILPLYLKGRIGITEIV